MKLLKKVVLDSPDKVRGAYYFPQWPAVHKAFNDAVTKAVTGKREDIAKVLADERAAGQQGGAVAVTSHLPRLRRMPLARRAERLGAGGVDRSESSDPAFPPPYSP